jgi:uncharacterized protein (DUF433 family)
MGTTVQLSAHTYELLARRARQVNCLPDALADQVLHRELQPIHPYIEFEISRWGERAVVKDANIPVSTVVGYVRLGLAPEQFAEEIHPALTAAHVHGALSYYYDHRDEIDREIAENTEETGRLRLSERMCSEDDYTKITGQR